MSASMLESGVYPTDWSDFVGQAKAIRTLKTAAASARARNDVLPHILLASPLSGIGKTSLALLVIEELGCKFRTHSGAITQDMLPFLFSDLGDGDVLFLDEIHGLFAGGKSRGEWLLHLLQDGVLMTGRGPEALPNITVIATTTDKGRLPEPVIRRFPLQPTLVGYNDAEAVLIVSKMAEKVLAPYNMPAPTEKVAAAISDAAANSPRVIRALLSSLRDGVTVGEIEPRGGDYDLTVALELAGLSHDGLDHQAEKYLLTMYSTFYGRPAGAGALAQQLGEVASGLVRIEEVLLRRDYITLSGRGRVLTPAGQKRAKQIDDAAKAA